MPRKPAQKRKSTSKRGAKKMLQLRKRLATALIFLSAVFFLSGYFVYKKITIEYASAFSSSSYDVLSEQIYTTVLASVSSFEEAPSKITSLTFIITDKKTQKLVKYNIPVDMEIDIPGRFGYEPLSNVYALGMLAYNNPQESAELLTKSVFKVMAFPADRYLLVEDSQFQKIEELFNEGLYIPIQDIDFSSLKDSVKTNMSIKEIFDVYSFVNSLPQDRIISKKVVESYVSNPLLLDEELMDITFDTEFSSEMKTVSLLNGSTYSGVASLCSRAVKNLGGRVVAVGNTQQKYEKSVIITDFPNTVTVNRLKNMYGIDNVIMKSAASEYKESEILRSDVTIILGLDFAESL